MMHHSTQEARVVTVERTADELSARRHRIRVALIDDHVALRRATELLLQRVGFAVVGGVADARDVYGVLRTHRPDVLVVDLMLPTGSGIVVAEAAAREARDCSVLIYTGTDDSELIDRALAGPAKGVALKSGGPEELVQAIVTVARGERYVDPRLEPRLAGRTTRLSAREREVLGFVAQGLTAEEIGRMLCVSSETVRTHIRNASQRLGARSRAHAVAMALRDGELPR